jgi:hypothetical protein
MSNWAVMRSGVVVNVIVADEGAAEILALIIPDADEFILVTDATGPALIGGDVLNDRFRSAQTYLSWLWDDESWSWVAPVPYPDGGNGYTWNEDALAWVEMPPAPEPEPASEE